MLGYFKELLQDRQFQKMALLIAIPLMLQQLVVSSVNLVDNLMVGQLGDVALSGVSNANRFYLIAWYGLNGMIASGVIYLSQFKGAEDDDRMKQTFRFMIVSSYALCILFFLVGLFFSEQIIGFFIKDNRVIALGSAYLRIAVFSYLPSTLSGCISSALRAMGETKIPLKVSIVSVLTNTFLNYVLIFGNFGMMALGVEGAAIATLIARLVEMSLYLIVLKRSDMPFKTRIKNIFRFDIGLARHVIIRGIPLCINEILFSFGISTLLKCYSNRGLAVNTAYSMANTISDMFFVLFAGMATASTVLIGTPLGANRLEEGKHNGYKLVSFSLILSLLFLSLMFGCSFLIPYLYNVSSEAKHLAADFLRVMAMFFVLYMFNTSCYFVLRAGGDTKSTLYMDSLFMWTFNIPLVALLSYFTTIPAIALYAIGQSTDLVKALLSYRLLKKEKWVRNLASQIKTE